MGSQYTGLAVGLTGHNRGITLDDKGNLDRANTLEMLARTEGRHRAEELLDRERDEEINGTRTNQAHANINEHTWVVYRPPVDYPYTRPSPTTESRKMAVPHPRKEDWASVKTRCRELYVDRGLTLNQLMLIMKREHGFEAW
jgi:hypothetical protein